jgi:uncharacterized protein (TIGR03067 family)
VGRVAELGSLDRTHIPMPDDHELLQGFWKLVDSSLGGKDHRHPDMGTVFRFHGNRFIHIRTPGSYRFELQSDTNPKGIDFILVSTRGVARGIYELDGDTLRIRKNGWGVARPTTFDDPVWFKHPVEVFTRYRRRVPMKRRVKALIPKTVIPGGLIPKGLLDDVIGDSKDAV